MAQDYSRDALSRLDLPCASGVSAEVMGAFRLDLRDAINLRNGPGIEFAPYVSPNLLDGVGILSRVPFPSVDTAGKGPYFAFMVRPVDGDGNSPDEFYGVPLVMGETVPLDKSGILERKLSVVRLSRDTKQSDELVSLIQTLMGKGTRVNQDLMVDGNYGDLLEAYEREGAPSFKGAQVHRLTAVIPVNPKKYATEASGFAVQNSSSDSQLMCFGYGIGETVYRGRPIDGLSQGRKL